MKLAAAVIAALLMFVAPVALAQRISPDEQKLAASVSDSVVILYLQDDAGDMKMTCTATAYRKIEDGYRFVSAAHCVASDRDFEQKQIKFFVTADKASLKSFVQVTLVEAGDKQVGDDFAIFEAKTDAVFAVTPLGDSATVKQGDSMLNIASPFGLGKQLFVGYVSLAHVDRPKIDLNEVQWTDVMMVNIGGGPGSSGSAIISEDQKAIVAFLVGSFNSGNVGAICIPVNKFKAFEDAVATKTYKKQPPKVKVEIGLSF